MQPALSSNKTVLRIVDFLRCDMVFPELKATSKPAVLAELAEHVARQYEAIDARHLKKVLEDRELLASTAIGDGIAIPHGKLDVAPHMIGAIGRSPAGLEFDSIDGKPTHLVFLLVAPTSSAGTHLKALARLSRLFRDALFRQRLIEAPTAQAMFDAICEEDGKY